MGPTLINLLQGRPFILRRLIVMWLFSTRAANQWKSGLLRLARLIQPFFLAA